MAQLKTDRDISVEEFNELVKGETILSVTEDYSYDADTILEFSLFYIIIVSGSCSGYGCCNYYLREKTREQL